ncbi:MAG: type VI secretion system baseplate subunit TssG [Azoarcus sp.]|jgi:type VI secretion system protein ImpH|nr:type VI secretion system baseplate subunit TssG [Azoarcus sp.]
MPESRAQNKAAAASKAIAASIDAPFDAELRETPWRFDWFEIMRWLEARNPGHPRFGTALHPRDEIVRIGQTPSLNFAPATLTGFGGDGHGRIRIEQAAFGLFGPNGPMPLHFTEFARERGEYDGDYTLQAFLDIFHHRFALLFYRAWARVQATASLDRPGADHFSRYASSLIGYGEPAFADGDAIPGHAKCHMAGHLARLTRNPEGLAAILRLFFACPFRIQEWMPHWLRLDERDLTFLGLETAASRLGRGAVCGVSALDRQHRFRIHAGPLELAGYIAFLPGNKFFRQLRDWVRNYVSYEFSWDVRLILRHDEVPAARLGAAACMLGWTTWLGRSPAGEDRGDLVLEGERAGARAA